MPVLLDVGRKDAFCAENTAERAGQQIGDLEALAAVIFLCPELKVGTYLRDRDW